MENKFIEIFEGVFLHLKSGVDTLQKNAKRLRSQWIKI